MPRIMAISFSDSDHRGRVYRRFTAERCRFGKGWIVQGTCDPDIGEHTYGGCVVMKVAEPIMGEGEFARCRKPQGFRTRKDAQRVADALNGMLPAFIPLPPCALPRRLEVRI